MNAQWATALITGLGFVANFVWTLVNLRIENKVLKHIDGVKDWALQTFVVRQDVAKYRSHNLKKTADA